MTASGFATIAPDGSPVVWQPPSVWRRRSVAPVLSPVRIDHYTARDVELLDMETTGVIFSMCLTAQPQAELRTDGRGWATVRIRTPLAYVVPGFSFSARWSMPLEWVNVHFDPSWVAQSGLQTKRQSFPQCDLSDDLLTQAVRAIHEDARAGMPLGPMYAETLGAAALRRMAYLESRPQAKEYAHAAMMRKAVEYIQEHFRDELTLLAVARAVDYPGDLYAFIRSFKKAHGLTPHQYIVERRLQAARSLIASGQCGVTEAAFACGFSTASHFSATFRKRWGISPSELKPGPADLMRGEARESTAR